MAPSFICLNCAEVISSSAEILQCPHCGAKIDHAKTTRLLYFGRNAFLFGYQYRSVFEADYAKSRRCSSRYQLDPGSDLLAFAAVAATSGIIGNAAYDVLKNVLARIARHYAQVKTHRDDPLAKLFSTEAGRRKFINYIHDYTNGLAGLRNLEVKRAIDGEIFTHLEIEARYHLDESKQRKFLQPPPLDDLNGLWREAATPAKAAEKPTKPKRNKRRKRLKGK